MTPMVSIIIPTYNRQELVQEAVASCLAQTYTNIEVLVIDDGSTDGTREMVAAKLQGDWAGKVFYHHKANGGTSSAKNLGVHVASGDYIQFLDSDDVLRPEKLDRQLAAIAAVGNEIDCCVCYGRLGYLHEGWNGAHRIGELCRDVPSYIQRQCERTVHIMHTESPLWRRDFLNGEAGWRDDLSVAEEWEYYIRLLVRQPRFVNVAEELFWVRVHEGEQLSKDFSSLKHSRSFYRAIRSVAELLLAGPYWSHQVEQGLIMRIRSVYVNVLRCPDSKLTRDLEDWMVTLGGKRRWMLKLIVGCRRLLGTELLLKLVTR